uniref:Putative ribonuclease H-like domain-containing protein n=1 Tax=Tanacetum cinerariifolium TaxID=118510 RepID=A0A6L2LYI3_TANCI|nr:putative ribonuclease H-like domain-containing protein [Tanacetum cinerariifolium]
MSSDKESSAAGTDNRAPMLEENDYKSWKICMKRYIRSKPQGKAIWKSIVEGPALHPMTATVTGVANVVVEALRPKRDEEFTAKENSRDLADIQAASILSQGLPRHIFNTLNQTKSAKEMWENIELLMKGSGLSEQRKQEELFDEYERFRAIGYESIQEYFIRFHKLAKDLKITKIKIPTHQQNTKFLNNLPSYWAKYVTSVKKNQDILTKSYVELYTYQKAYEPYALKTLKKQEQSSSSVDPLAYLAHSSKHQTTTTLVNLLSGFQKQFPPMNNQLRTSSNPKSHATMHEGKIVTETIQRKTPSNVSNAGTKGNQGYGKKTDRNGKKVFCYNYRGEGHVARECKKPKRAKDTQYYKDKMMPSDAKDRGVILDAKAESFLADVECTELYDESLALTTTTAFQVSHEDAYDFDVDDGPHAAAAFMANLSSTEEANGTSSSKINEVHSNASDSYNLDTDDNTMPYQQYLLLTEAAVPPTEKPSEPHYVLPGEMYLQDKITTWLQMNDHGTYTPIRRPFNRTKAPKVNFAQHKVNTARDKSVSVVGGKWETVIKASDNPHQTLKGKGIINNGCSRHMTGNKAYLVDYQDFNGGPVAFGDTECLVLSLDFKLSDENQVLLRVPRQHNMYSFNLENIVHSRGFACLIVKATIDESTKWYRRFSWVFFLRTKDETSGILNDFIRQIENQLNQKVKTLRFDNGIEFKNRDIIEFCGSKGIKREYSNAKTPQQNGVAERKNKTLIEAARTMLADSFLPITFWAEAVSTACYVLNRVLVTKPQKKTPYELLTGKFKEKSDEGFLVGYSLSSKAFRVYNLESKRVEENLHINFIENKPNVAGNGPTWLFDLDYVTDLMNYQSITAENKANKNAADHAQEYYVLHLWSSYTSTVKSSKAKNGDKKLNEDTDSKTNEKPVDQEDLAFLEELERLKRQEKEGNDAAETHRKTFAQSTKDLLLQAGAARASSTNYVNTANTPVNVASTPLNIASTPTNQDDSQIPSLEDIYEVSRDGIFTCASYDDEGAVADFTNLETIVNVSPIPTSRIYSIHHTIQILRYLTLAVQTRSRVNKSSGAHAFTRGGIDYDEVFAPVARIEAIRIFLAFASYMGFIVYQVDVKSAFVYGKINEEVYVSQPPGFIDPKFPNKVYKVVKALYGLHQAPRAWYATLSTFLVQSGYRRGLIDKTLFIKKDKKDIMLVQVYVDDIIFGSTKNSWCDEFETLRKNRFQMSSMGELAFFLELQVKQKEDCIFISHDKYVAEILKKFTFLCVKTASTPIETKKPLVKDEKLLIFQVTPKTSHLQAVKRIFRYLKGQPTLGLWYPRESAFDLEAYSDSNYAGANLDRKSTTGCCQFLGRRLILWQCKKQKIVASPTIYTSCTKQFWTSAKVKTVNDEVKIQALVDGKRVNIKESSIRRTLRLDDAEGTSCLTNIEIFKGLAKMGLVKNIEAGVPFFMFPRFIQLIINHQMGDVAHHKEIFDTPSLTKKVFANMQRVGTGFSGQVTLLFDNMLVQAPEEVGILQADAQSIPITTESSTYKPQKKHKPKRKHTQESEVPPTPAEQNLPLHSNDPLPSGEDSLKLKELMDLCTNLSNKVLELESEVIDIKSTYQKRIEKLEGSVERLEEENRVLKELKSVHSIYDVDEPIMEKEKSSKQERKIADIDADVEINLEKA